MQASVPIPFAAACLLLLPAACAVLPDEDEPKATARMEARSGSQASGSVGFTQKGGKVRVEASMRGLAPGEHGFHIHETGDCSAPDAASAQEHFNPVGVKHGYYGSSEHHAGDMPNLIADAEGVATYQAEISTVTLNTGPHGILGRSVVVHADPDDYKTQPTGNSGKHIACGVITPPPDSVEKAAR